MTILKRNLNLYPKMQCRVREPIRKLIRSSGIYMGIVLVRHRVRIPGRKLIMGGGID